jgi:N-formylglutamate amidohydrolase
MACEAIDKCVLQGNNEAQTRLLRQAEMQENSDNARAPRPFEIIAPSAWTQPAVFNSPHSGRCYDAAFLATSRLTALTLRRSEDCYVDELFACVTELGSPLLRANFPRAYLDVNREPYELDPRMFHEALPGFANTTSVRVAGGLGTIPRIVSEGEEIYRAPLPLSEALRRIEGLYRPYHRTLTRLLSEVHGKFGAVVLVDCHSMPSSAVALQQSAGSRRADIVIGDRHGSACAYEITAYLEELFAEQGFCVIHNKPYAGGFITHNYGSPAGGYHALQVEINRALYVNEQTLERLPDFPVVAQCLREIMKCFLPAVADLLQPRRIAAE